MDDEVSKGRPVSTTVEPSTETLSARRRMVATMPTISSTVSPLARSAATKAPSWAGVVSPDMMRSMAQEASQAASPCPESNRLSTMGQVSSVKAQQSFPRGIRSLSPSADVPPGGCYSPWTPWRYGPRSWARAGCRS